MPGNRTDYGTEQTDRAVKRVERRLSSVYRQAQRDIDDKLKDWQERHKKRDARYRQMVAAGKMSKEDYRAWLRGQVFQEKQWQARRDEIDNILLNADRAAQNIVNEGKLGVFTANANYMGYALERDSNIDTGFVLYSESTVARLIEDDPQILPKPAPGVQKDLAFPYYNKLMSSAITQGIVQGETISEIAGRVARTTGESSYKSAMRNARTAYTGAQNAGRIEGLHQAQRLGIKVKKKWLAILDSRTRDTHRDLDGQTQEVDDPFKSDLGDIMFPGDPTAKPALTYNCRCTLTYEYPDYPSTMPRRDAENGQIVADMTYREWEASKSGKNNSADEYTDTAQRLSEELAPWTSEYPSYDDYARAKETSNGSNEFIDDSNWILSQDQVDAAKRFDHSLAVMQKEYPAPNGENIAVGNYDQMISRLTERQKQMTVHENDPTVRGQLWHTPDGYVVGINPSKNPAKFDLSGRKSGGQYVGGISPETLAVHEYGHIMQDYIAQSQYTDGVTDVTRQVLSLWRDNKGAIREQLSSYAEENMNEMMAECFTQCVLYHRPSPIAMEYGDLLTEASGGRIRFPYQRRR